MNKRTLLSILPAAALLLLSACTQDEPGGQGNELPYGEYPLQIGGVTLDVESSAESWSAEGPQTRVAENDNGTGSVWQWNGSEMIGVRLGNETATYTLNADKNLITDRQLYWTSTAPTTVTAWYPTDETVNLSDQTEGLAYMLKAEVPGATYNNEIALDFKHQLAKVRVVLNGTQAGQVESVEVYSITACNHLRGSLDYNASNTGWIKMKKQTFANDTECWEANVVPGEVISQIKVNNTEATLTASLTPKVAALNTITINVEQAPTEIDLDTYEGTTLPVSGKTILKGDGTTPKDLQITVEADAEVTLENVVLQPSALGNAITCKGDATIILTGSSSLTAKSNFFNGNYVYVERGTLTINGDGSLNISREYVDGSMNVGAGIGAAGEANIVIENGDISIGEVPEKSGNSGAGIGSLYDESCGDITINGGTISIGQPSWYSACIGSAQHGSCGNITISGESTVITFTKGELAPCGIGNGGERGTCGTVTITDGATVNGARYYDHTGTL